MHHEHENETRREDNFEKKKCMIRKTSSLAVMERLQFHSFLFHSSGVGCAESRPRLFRGKTTLAQEAAEKSPKTPISGLACVIPCSRLIEPRIVSTRPSRRSWHPS